LFFPPDWASEEVMESSNIYDRYDAPPTKRRNWTEVAQITVLSAIVLVFLVIAGGSAVGLLANAMHH